MSTMNMKGLAVLGMAVALGVLASTGNVIAQGVDANTTPMLVQSSQFLGHGEGWVSDGGQILFTHDGGSIWQNITPENLPGTMLQIAFADAVNGWIVTADAKNGINRDPCGTGVA